MNLVKLLFSTIKRNKILLFLGLLSSVISVWIALRVPFINQSIIDDGIFANNMDILVSLCVWLTLLYIFEYVLKLFSSYVFTKISKEYTKNIYIKVIENLFYKKHQFFVENNSGELLHKVSEVWNLEDSFTVQLFDSALSIFTFFIAIGVLFSLSIPVTILTIISIFVVGIFYWQGNRIMSQYLPKVLNKNAEVTSKVQEIILGIFEIRSNNASKMFQVNNEKK